MVLAEAKLVMIENVVGDKLAYSAIDKVLKNFGNNI